MGRRRLTVLAGSAALAVSFGACGSEDSGSSARTGGRPAAVVDSVAYVKQHGDDSGWYRLDPPSSTRAELVAGFGADLGGDVTADGTRIATRDASSPGGYTVRDSDGNALSSQLVGESFAWNPAGTLGAYNLGDFTGPIAVVDRDGAPEPDWTPTAAQEASTGTPIDPSQITFESWVSDDALFVTVGDSDPAIAKMDGGSMVITPIAVDNPNYPAFDRQGKGIFVDETALRQVDTETGEIKDLAVLDPAPESDYIARDVSWSPVASTFSVDTVDGSQICTWSDTLTCNPVLLPPGFVSEGAVFSIDGKTVAYNGYVDGPAPDWHPLTVDLSTMKARPLPFSCSGTCYLYAYMARP